MVLISAGGQISIPISASLSWIKSELLGHVVYLQTPISGVWSIDKINKFEILGTKLTWNDGNLYSFILQSFHFNSCKKQQNYYVEFLLLTLQTWIGVKQQ